MACNLTYFMLFFRPNFRILLRRLGDVLKSSSKEFTAGKRLHEPYRREFQRFYTGLNYMLLGVKALSNYEYGYLSTILATSPQQTFRSKPASALSYSVCHSSMMDFKSTDQRKALEVFHTCIQLKFMSVAEAKFCFRHHLVV